MKDQTSDSLRQEALNCAKNFKSNWIEMGRMLYTVYRGKNYRDWGYREFETYCAKEIGIKALTAQKLLRSYHFLEKEETSFASKDRYEDTNAAKIPDYESVNVLRLAKNRKIDEEDYSDLRKKVLEEARPVQAVRKEYRALVEAAKDEPPEEAEAKKRKTSLRRLLSTLKALQTEFMQDRSIPKGKLAEIKKLTEKLESLANELL
jgi:hypothetical protein